MESILIAALIGAAFGVIKWLAGRARPDEGEQSIGTYKQYKRMSDARLLQLAERDPSVVGPDWMAQYELSARLLKSSLKRNRVQGFRWCLKVAQQGHEIAMNQVGRLYHSGLGIPQDQAQGMEWIRKAVALRFERGRESERDWTGPEKFWESAYEVNALRGDHEARFILAALYSMSLAHEDPKRVSQAVAWLQESAEAEAADAQWLFGLLRLCGVLTQTADTVADALEWQTRAAQQGHPLAASVLEDWPDVLAKNFVAKT